MALRISDLGTAPTVEETDLVEIAEVDVESPSGYSSYKTTILGIANKVATGTQYTGLNTIAKNLVGAINEAAEGSTVEVTPILTEGTKIATITVDDTPADLYGENTKEEIRKMKTPKTVTGNPVTFETIEKNCIKEATATFTPKQDLHGYDHPWSGGNGKNKYSVLIGDDAWTNYNDATSSGVNGVLSITTTSTTNSGVYASSTNKLNIYCGSNTGVHTLSAYVKASANATLRMGFSGLSSEDFSITTEWQRISVTVTLDGSAHSIIFYSRGDAVTYDIKDVQLETGETATDYYPYSNICPISGRDSLVLSNGGKNRVIYVIENSFIDTNGVILYSEDYDMLIAPVTQGKKYTITTNGTQPRFGYYVNAPKFNSVSYNATRATASGTVFTVTAPINGYIAARCKHGFTNWQIEDGETATTRQAPTDYTITFSDTIYGGSYDFVSGEGVIDTGYVDLGTLEWTRDAQYGHFNATIPNMYAPESASERNKGIICSQYKPAVGTNANQMTDGEMLRANGRIYIMDSNYTTEADFKTAMSGVQLCYELATPTQIELTGQAIEALKGVNVVSTDADTAAITYTEMTTLDDMRILINAQMNL